MALSTQEVEFYQRWRQKAQTYELCAQADSQPIDLGGTEQCIDKFFTLFVVYNTLYSKVALTLQKEALQAGKDEYKWVDGRFPDDHAATDYINAFLGSTSLINALEASDSTKGAINDLIVVLGQFNIALDPLTGFPNKERDEEFLNNLRGGNDFNRAMAILRIIYNVRCNMFHGRKDLHSVQGRLLIPLIVLLEKIIELVYRRLNRRNPS